MSKLAAVAVAAALAACAHAAPAHPRWPDAPLELRDDKDRVAAIDHLWILPLGADRDAHRAALADAIAHRLRDALDEERTVVAEQLVGQLASLWRDDPAACGPALAPHVPLLRMLRASFAKSGQLEPSVLLLALLAEADRGSRAATLAELDEILAFADEVAVAQNGAEATRAQPIALLGPAATTLPLRWLVDRYVGLLEERQRTVAARIAAQGASIELVRAHHDVLSTSREIAIVLARAGRTPEIAAHLDRITGLGADKELALHAEIVSDQPTANAYEQLAKALRIDERMPDADAALAVDLAGLAKFPHDRALLASAALDAAAVGRIDQPIAFYEASLAAGGSDADPLLAFHLGKLYAERITRLASGGRPAAADAAWHEVGDVTSREAKRALPEVWAQVRASAEAALGQGLVGQGRIAEAEKTLASSVARMPNIDAIESLATIYEKTDRFEAASRAAGVGLSILGESLGDRYRRARLQRIAGDVARLAGRSREAQALYVDSINSWASLGHDDELRPSIRAERKLDESHSAWFIGHADQSIELAFAALDSDPDATGRAAEAATFLLEVGRYTDALDAVHRGLLSPAVSELTKVYMCLWVLADGRRHGEARDRLAYEYLAARHGELWYERLAEAATGRLALGELRAAATSAARQAELAFYTAALGLGPAADPAHARALLEQVVDAHVVNEAEYDLARRYLAAP